MIAYIKGTVNMLADQYTVLDNQGIGYIINASSSTLSRLPPKGELVQLYTYLQVKEDGMSLFGFLTHEELQLFRILISVSGIGPKVAMACLSVLSPDQIITAVISQDSLLFNKVPGVGKKMAQRITLELQDKIKTYTKEPETGLGLQAGDLQATMVSQGAEKQDAILALITLGYSRSESMQAVLAVAEEDMSTEQIIRLALKKLA